MSKFLFPADNLSKYQWIFTKLCMCIDIIEICFGFANGQVLSIFHRVICPDTSVFLFQDNNLSKSQQIYFKLDTVEL